MLRVNYLKPLFTVIYFCLAPLLFAEEKARLVIMADMGNEPDEEQQMVHMLMYNNEFDLEGLIAVSGFYLHADHPEERRRKVYPELFDSLIDGYEKVYPSLKKHAQGWHEPDYLRSIVKAGQPKYGYQAVGEGFSTPGSDLILEVLTKNDPRPVYFVGNAGTNTLAQAIWEYKQDHTKAEIETFIGKIRVYENGAQDDAGAMIVHENPSIIWLRSNYQTYGWGGKDRGPAADGPYVWQPYPHRDSAGRIGPGQHQWTREHIQTGHGALGALYPDRHKGYSFLEGGGTSPWIGLVNKGLYDPEETTWGGWGGRFSRERTLNYLSRHNSIKEVENDNFKPFSVFSEVSDKWVNPETGEEFEDIAVPVYRWRRAGFNDFRGRMDWCVKNYNEANHNPIAAFRGDTTNTILRMEGKLGELFPLDAAGTKDPDGDEVSYKWWIYPEPSTYKGKLSIPDSSSEKTVLQLPVDGVGKTIHVILEVWDKNSIVNMVDYRRIVIDLKKN